MQISVRIQLSAILKPDDVGPGLAFGYAEKHNFVAKDVLVVKMRSLCDFCPLQTF